MKFIKESSMIQQRLGLVLPLLMVAKDRRFASAEELASAYYNFIGAKHKKWLYPNDPDFYGHRGIPSKETALEYVKWAMELNLLDKNFFWTHIAQSLYVISNDSTKAWLEDAFQVNPLILTPIQKMLFFIAIIEKDGDFFNPFLKDINNYIVNNGSINLFEASGVYIERLKKISDELLKSNSRQDYKYGNQLKKTTNKWKVDYDNKKNKIKSTITTAEHRVTPKLEAAVDLYLLTKNPSNELYRYYGTDRLNIFMKYVDNIINDDLNIYYISQIFDCEIIDDEFNKIIPILETHRQIRDTQQISLKRNLMLLTSLLTLNNYRRIYLIKDIETTLNQLFIDYPEYAYIMVNEWGIPSFVFIDEELIRRMTNG